MQRNCILNCNRLLATTELTKIYLKGFTTAIISGDFFNGIIIFQTWFVNINSLYLSLTIKKKSVYRNQYKFSYYLPKEKNNGFNDPVSVLSGLL